jgi:hypothetical protein
VPISSIESRSGCFNANAQMSLETHAYHREWPTARVPHNVGTVGHLARYGWGAKEIGIGSRSTSPKGSRGPGWPCRQRTRTRVFAP